jgi:hypothetical protein
MHDTGTRRPGGDERGESAPLVMSPDGYLRLGVPAFRAIRLSHLLSELDADADLPRGNACGACEASISGYTEWVSDGRPALSLGWDWRIATGVDRLRYQRDGEVRSNVMLLDARRRDLGARATAVLLCAAIDTLEWHTAVEHCIRHRYSGSHGHGRDLVNFTAFENRSSL